VRGKKRAQVRVPQDVTGAFAKVTSLRFDPIMRRLWQLLAGGHRPDQAR
jgi:hypothetical protein